MNRTVDTPGSIRMRLSAFWSRVLNEQTSSLTETIVAFLGPGDVAAVASYVFSLYSSPHPRSVLQLRENPARMMLIVVLPPVAHDEKEGKPDAEAAPQPTLLRTHDP